MTGGKGGEVMQESGRPSATCDQFLLAQFGALTNHIGHLFAANTQRVSAYLVFVGICFAAGTYFENGGAPHDLFHAPGATLLVVVGLMVWERTVRMRVQVVKYIRIINDIRGHFAKSDTLVGSLCSSVLPVSNELPRWNAPVFDPGTELVAVVTSSAAAYAFTAVLAPASGAPICTIILFGLSLVLSYVCLRVRRDSILRKYLDVPVRSAPRGANLGGEPGGTAGQAKL